MGKNDRSKAILDIITATLDRAAPNRRIVDVRDAERKGGPEYHLYNDDNTGRMFLVAIYRGRHQEVQGWDIFIPSDPGNSIEDSEAALVAFLAE